MLCMYMQWDLQHHAYMHPCMHACMLCIDPVTRSYSRDKLLAHLLASQQQLISLVSGFTVETALAVSGGDLDTPQLLKYERVSGACLFKLAKRDRTLARIVGQITHRGKRLFDGIDVFDFVRDLRNAAIDKAINGVLVLKTPWLRTSLMQKAVVGQGMSSGKAMTSSI